MTQALLPVLFYRTARGRAAHRTARSGCATSQLPTARTIVFGGGQAAVRYMLSGGLKLQSGIPVDPIDRSASQEDCMVLRRIALAVWIASSWVVLGSPCRAQENLPRMEQVIQ